MSVSCMGAVLSASPALLGTPVAVSASTSAVVSDILLHTPSQAVADTPLVLSDTVTRREQALAWDIRALRRAYPALILDTVTEADGRVNLRVRERCEPVHANEPASSAAPVQTVAAGDVVAPLCGSEAAVPFAPVISARAVVAAPVRCVLYDLSSDASASAGALRDADGVPVTATVRASLGVPYPAYKPHTPVPVGVDPGRVRSDAWLALLWGGTQRDVERRLVRVRFCGTLLRVNGQHGLPERVVSLSRALEVAMRDDPSLRDIIQPVSSHAWRHIAGTKRLSSHAYGIAIDLNPQRGLYWRWEPQSATPSTTRRQAARLAKALAATPERLVRLFEEHGFIWGGRWHAYDLMHFEYRPELLEKMTILSHEHAVRGE